MKLNDVNSFLKDLTYGSSFRFLEEGKDGDKLKEIASKKGIVLPAHDLAVFECIYAFTDRQNKNGCTLPRAEVENSLPTLIGKSIDLDHFRKNVVGHWIDAKLDGDKIIAYGCVFKGSFEEDFNVIKELFDKGNLAVSFEAWGDRVPNETGYDLTSCEFAGGALLLKSEPAFDGAGVLELAKTRVLEFAKVMTAPKEFAHAKDPLESARMYVHDMDGIMRSLSQVDCPSCKESMCMEPSMIDYSNNKVKAECVCCGAEAMCDMTPPATLTKKGRKIQKLATVSQASVAYEDFIADKEISDERLEVSLEEALKPYPKLDLTSRFELADDSFAIVKNIEIDKGKERKLRIIPIHDLAHINLARVILTQSNTRELLEKLSIPIDNVERKISRRMITIAMKSLMEKYKKANANEVIQEIAKVSISRELTKEELEKAYSIVDLKASKGDANSTSLQSKTGGNSDGNATSLQNAEVSEDDVKAAITEATKAPVEVVVTEDAKVVELEAKLTEANAKLVEATAKIEAFVKAQEQATAEAEAKKKADLIKARRDELAEVATDMKDEDLLDEIKFALAKKDKEIAELKKGSKKTTVDLSKGSNDKEVETPEQASRKKVAQMAFDKRYREQTKSEKDEE